MNETEAVVVRVEGDHAWVEVAGPGHACGACASRDGCQSAPPGGGAKQLLRLPNTIRARPGDVVMVRAAGGTILRAVWLAYGVPLLLALVGAMLAIELTGSEAAAVAGVLLGLGIGILLMRYPGLVSRRAEPILSLDFKHTSRFIVRGS